MMKERLLRLFSIFLCLVIMWSVIPAAPAAAAEGEEAAAGGQPVQVRIFYGARINTRYLDPLAECFEKKIGTYEGCPIKVTANALNNSLSKLKEITTANTQLLIILCPDQAIPEEYGIAIREYMKKGGCVWLNGENQTYWAEENRYLSDLSAYLDVSYSLGTDSESGIAKLNTKSSLGKANRFNSCEEITLAFANNILVPASDHPPESIITKDGKTYMIDAPVEKGYLTVSADLNILFYGDNEKSDPQILYNMLDRSYTEIQKNRLPHTPPVGLELTYNGEEQTLVKPGEVDSEIGTMFYSLDKENWSEMLPVDEEVGTYPVYWRIEAKKEGYFDIGPEMVTSRILPDYNPPSGKNLVYTGEEQTLGTKGEVDGGIMLYRLNGTDWSENFPRGLEPGKYTIHWKIVLKGENKSIAEGTVTSTITAAPAPQPTPQPAPQPAPRPSSGSSDPGYLVKIIDKTPPGGSVKTSRYAAKERETVFITAAPIAGHHVQTVSVVDKNGNALSVEDLGGGRYSFKMARGWVEVSVTFAGNTAGAGTQANTGTQANAGTQANTGIQANTGVEASSGSEAQRTDNSAPRSAGDAAYSQTGFTDVSAGAWYYDGVRFCLDKGLLDGGGAFRPNDKISRAAFLTMLWRLSGSPASHGTLPFDDVAEGAWYAGAVRWAVEKKIISNNGGRFFGAGLPLTREQMITILWRYARHEGKSVPEPEGNPLAVFADTASISGYARSAMEWAYHTGLLSGRNWEGFQVLAPREEGSRAQAAALLARYAQDAKK